jgi:lipoprotein-anchoring transpeptidase ErfK/SrfK
MDKDNQAFLAGKGLLDRRSFLMGSVAGLGALSLAGCATIGSRAQFDQNYAALPNERFPIPAVDVSLVDSRYLRQTVRYDSTEPVGTIVVDTPNYFVYRVEADGLATRYGASVGAAAFLWSGEAYIGRKAEWPIWTPTPAQIGRDPSLVQYAGGMQPGLDNPLGARALYLYQNGAYTLYTIYGTVHTQLIGANFGSGCIGLLSQDIIHLFEQTPVGTNVIVLPA